MPTATRDQARLNAALRWRLARGPGREPAEVRDAAEHAIAEIARGELGPTAGATFGPYRVGGLLGRGGQALVHRAVDTRLDRAVALKRPASAVQTAAEVLRFRREARIGSALRHPCLATVFEAGEVRGIPFVATELLPGPTLATCIAADAGQGPVSLPGCGGSGPDRLRRVLEVVGSLADAVGHMHERGFVHRDVKPANVAFAADGTPVLFDFGIARARDESDPLDLAGIARGSPGFVAPELLEGECADPRLDVFGLGALLSALTRGCPEVEAAVRSATATDPDRRPPTAAAFAAILRRIGRGSERSIAAEVG
jgi:serine/threonine-protein kinase